MNADAKGGHGRRVLRLEAFAACMLASLTALPAQAGTKGIFLPPAVFRVGAFGPPCTHATLSSAINAAASSGSTVIRVANNQVYNSINVNISGKNVTIEGGYVDCAASAPQPNTRTTLTGAAGSNDSVIEIIGGINERTVVLRDLEIEGGESDADGGGGVEIDGSAVVTFDNLLIAQNRSSDGGGVHVSGAANPVELRFEGGTELLNLDSAALLQNEATGHGGGLYCEQATIRVDGVLRSWINTAGARGGGLYLDDCDLTVGQLGADTDRLLLTTNEASSGGGIWAENGSVLVLRGLRHEIELNRAHQAGGGIGLTGALTAMYADSTSLNLNRVFNESDLPLNSIESAYGGGLYLAAGALADFDGGLLQPCPTPFDIIGSTADEPTCVRIRGNEARAVDLQGLGLGAGIYVNNAELRVRQARLVANTGDFGTAVFAVGDASAVLLESVVVDRNLPGSHALHFASGADATVAFATLVDASDGAPIRALGAGTTLGLHASVIADSVEPGVDIDSEATVQVSCLIASLDASVPTIAQSMTSDFIAMHDDDYRPSRNSQLIDRCNDTPYAPTSRDARGVARPIDDPARPNNPGTYDVGAFEGVPEQVFADSFESAL